MEEKGLTFIFRGKVRTAGFPRRMFLTRGAEDMEGAFVFPAPFLGRSQGCFVEDERGCCYVEFGEKNHARLNGRPLMKETKTYLKDGDLLSFSEEEVRTDDDYLYILFGDKCSAQSWNRVSFRAAIDQVTGCSAFRRSNVGWAVLTKTGQGEPVTRNGQAAAAPGELMTGEVIGAGGRLFIVLEDGLLYQLEKAATVRNSNIAGAPTNLPLTIDLKERTVRVHFRKHTLLKDIRLTVEPGEMVLILGGSGAGKTTFMNAVMGYEKGRGRILYGNTDIYSHFSTMKHQIGFVPQADLMRTDDTVRRTLDDAAKLKLPLRITTNKKARLARVDEVMAEMGLTNEANELVSKLSGGQRKRLSIAIELISDPGLFFLDEPDSGLDGNMARNLMEELREIAEKGKIVLVISHSPDRAADLFDKVIVLAKSEADNIGHLAYYGSVGNAFRFFGTESLEEIVKKVNRKDEGGDGQADDFIRSFSILRRQREQSGRRM
jgi:ABC-type multidrug transport system ATPase subunit